MKWGCERLHQNDLWWAHVTPDSDSTRMTSQSPRADFNNNPNQLHDESRGMQMRWQGQTRTCFVRAWPVSSLQMCLQTSSLSMPSHWRRHSQHENGRHHMPEASATDVENNNPALGRADNKVEEMAYKVTEHRRETVAHGSNCNEDHHSNHHGIGLRTDDVGRLCRCHGFLSHQSWEAVVNNTGEKQPQILKMLKSQLPAQVLHTPRTALHCLQACIDETQVQTHSPKPLYVATRTRWHAQKDVSSDGIAQHNLNVFQESLAPTQFLVSLWCGPALVLSATSTHTDMTSNAHMQPLTLHLLTSISNLQEQALNQVYILHCIASPDLQPHQRV